MQFLAFIIAYPFLLLISILPFRIFYWISDLIFLVVYYIIGYRKETVKNNLKIALPHLTDAERLVIEKKFYHHFCDLFMEMVKTMTISPEEIQQRFKITNPELLKEFEEKNRSIMVLASHYASWEWLIAINLKSSYQGVAVYKRIANRYFDNLIKKIRSEFKTELVSTEKTIPLMANNQRKGILSLYGLISDQSPKTKQIAHWESFMGIETPVHIGPELLSKKYNLNVVFAKVTKVKRGYYEATLIPITDEPKSLPNYEIIHRYIKEVEKQIYEVPEYYFWTHKRWKHQPE
ncbi:lysophospholipid acyltransferase family protein [Flavobacterium flavipallidum]|uniref:Lysophospholipid acyltransferase family protein n=1 Tax=Flavobacterium flavipallidum TaxID=3139140 RepID=A0ABU9HKT1_9FLAO